MDIFKCLVERDIGLLSLEDKDRYTPFELALDLICSERGPFPLFKDLVKTLASIRGYKLPLVWNLGADIISHFWDLQSFVPWTHFKPVFESYVREYEAEEVRSMLNFEVESNKPNVQPFKVMVDSTEEETLEFWNMLLKHGVATKDGNGT